MDDLMARFENLNTGPYARQPMEPRPENILVPDELSDRLEELRNPGKKQREEEERIKEEEERIEELKYQTEKDKIKVYGEQINEETRNKDKWKNH